MQNEERLPRGSELRVERIQKPDRRKIHRPDHGPAVECHHRREHLRVQIDRAEHGAGAGDVRNVSAEESAIGCEGDRGHRHADVRDDRRDSGGRIDLVDHPRL
jgi:hypothetical protein